jgi:uncharacterized cupin superfamily protein
MRLFDSQILKNEAVIHPYENNPEFKGLINTFFYSKDKKALAGYWEAPRGWFTTEIGEQSELNFIIEGEIDIINLEDENKKISAKKGDVFLVERGDKVKWVINEPLKTIYFIYPSSEQLTGFFESFQEKQ